MHPFKLFLLNLFFDSVRYVIILKSHKDSTAIDNISDDIALLTGAGLVLAQKTLRKAGTVRIRTNHSDMNHDRVSRREPLDRTGFVGIRWLACICDELRKFPFLAIRYPYIRNCQVFHPFRMGRPGLYFKYKYIPPKYFLYLSVLSCIAGVIHMKNTYAWMVIGIILLSCLISFGMAEKAGNLSLPLSGAMKTTEKPVICDQPYALCDTAFCVPAQDDPSTMICSCSVEKGPSLGGDDCSAIAPVGMYQNENGEWMIKAGYAVGQVTSTYSFHKAAPVEGREIYPNNTSPDYTGDVYLKTCKNGNWADCWNAPCSVLPEDITADINTERKASDNAVCNCGLVVNSSEWYVGVNGAVPCGNESLCNNNIISGASPKVTDTGMDLLAKYLSEHPGSDPTQQYKMGYCENCTDCTA
jgi:hypothetical protein